MLNTGGKALIEVGAYPATELIQTLNAGMRNKAVGLREMSFVVERERTQTVS